MAAVADVGPSVGNWPYEESDFSPDSSLVRGVLPNGLRYIIKKNGEPEGRVAAFLGILAGSLQEKENQQGVAHFLEHMMFNGSANFPPGTLINYFQSIGMAYGGDTNAYTGFDRTVYHLILPSGELKDLETGCLVLADYARGALLLDSEIDRERGVIFAEKRARDSSDYRNHVAYSEFAFNGTRYAERFPIGSTPVLEKADHTLLKSFYDSWYRPDNTLLVLVGDLDTKLAQRVIEKHFSPLAAAPEQQKRAHFGKLELGELEVYYNNEPELGKVNVSIETMWDTKPQPQMRAGEIQELAEIVGEFILGYRLKRLQEKKQQPFAAAYYSSGEILRRIGYGSIYGVTDQEHWRQTMAVLHDVLAGAIKFGFREQELLRAKKEITAELQEDAAQEASLHSRTIAKRIVEHFMENDVYMSPSQELVVYGEMLKQMTLEDVNRVFREIWGHKRRLLSVSGDLDLGDGGEDQVKALYNGLKKKDIIAEKQSTEIRFPYLDVQADSGETAEKEDHREIGVTSFRLKNGLVVHLKKTDFEEGKVRLAAHFGHGEQAETARGMAYFADDIINLSGTGRYSVSDLDTIVAGSSVDLSFQMGEASNSWYGSCLTSDLELQVQLLHALLVDPGFKETAYKKIMRGLDLMYRHFESEIDGAVYLKVQPFLAGNNIHFGLPPYEEAKNLDFNSLKHWALGALKVRDLEISMVGDFDETRVLELLRHYFGGLQLSPPPVRRTDKPVVFPKGEELRLVVGSQVEKSRVYIAWPTEDFWDISRTRRLNILAEIMENRFLEVVREKLGASYSPDVSNFGSRVHTDFGYIVAELNVEEGMEDSIIGEVKRLVEELHQGNISIDELERAKNPIVTGIHDNIKTNPYWLYSVLSLSARNPEQLLWPTTIVEDFKSIQLSEIKKLAKKYLVDDRSAVVSIKAKNR